MSTAESMLNAEIAAWNRLEAKVKDAIELAKRARYDSVSKAQGSTGERARLPRDYMKQMQELVSKK